MATSNTSANQADNSTVDNQAVDNGIWTEERALNLITAKANTMIESADKYQLRVTNVHPYTNRKTGEPILIVNFLALTPYLYDEANELLDAGKYQEAASVSFSTNVRVGKDYQPTKGEFVNVQIVSRDIPAGPDKNGVYREASVGLFGSVVTPIPPKAPGKRDPRADMEARKLAREAASAPAQQ